MTEAASLNTGHDILLDASFTIIDESTYVLEGTYVVTINHRRPDTPTEFQGRLRWVVTQGDDGLWELSEWTDQELGSVPSWSDLKAEFVK